MAAVVASPRVGALARRLVRRVAERTRAELAAAGFPELRPVHNVVFGALAAGGARVTEIAEAAGITKQAVTLLVDYLEARGYVARVPDPRDGRAKLVELTERGRAAAATSLAVVEELERGFARRLGDARLAELRRLLADVVASLAEDRRPPAQRPGPAATEG